MHPHKRIKSVGAIKKGQYPTLMSLGSIEYEPLWLFYRGAGLRQGRRVLVFLDKTCRAMDQCVRFK